MVARKGAGEVPGPSTVSCDAISSQEQRTTPLPARRKPPQQSNMAKPYDDGAMSPSMGSHMKMIRQLSPPSVAGFDNDFDQNTQGQYSSREDFSQPPAGGNMGVGEYDIPETTIGRTVKMKGDISFNTLLRIDGSFEGKLTSNGNLVVGQDGVLIGDIIGMNEVTIEGRVVGSIQVEVLVLKSGAQVYGNVTAKTLAMQGGSSVVGTLNVNPYAPERVNTEGELAIVEEELAAPELDSARSEVPAPAPAPAPDRKSVV